MTLQPGRGMPHRVCRSLSAQDAFHCAYCTLQALVAAHEARHVQQQVRMRLTRRCLCTGWDLRLIPLLHGRIHLHSCCLPFSLLQAQLDAREATIAELQVRHQDSWTALLLPELHGWLAI